MSTAAPAGGDARRFRRRLPTEQQCTKSEPNDKKTRKSFRPGLSDGSWLHRRSGTDEITISHAELENCGGAILSTKDGVVGRRLLRRDIGKHANVRPANNAEVVSCRFGRKQKEGSANDHLRRRGGDRCIYPVTAVPLLCCSSVVELDPQY